MSRHNEPKSLLSPTSLLTKSECEDIVKRVMAQSTAQETRVNINSSARADTRFAVNQVSTSGENRDTNITISVVVDGRQASVNTNRADDKSIGEAVKQAIDIAKLVPVNPERMPSLGPQTYPAARALSISLPTAAQRAAAVKKVTERARAAGLNATGYIECTVNASCLASSTGLFAYDQSAAQAMTATVRSPDGTGSGWACGDSDNFDQIDADLIAATAVEKAKSSRNPVAIEPGRYTTILEPVAAANMVTLIFGSLQARSADEGRSFFSKQGGGTKLGSKFIDERVTLMTDPADNYSTNGGFDGNGFPAEKVTWVENGVLKTLAYDRFWAQKKGVEPTHGAGGAPVRMMGGDSSITKMVASTERGILVTRLWYIRPVDPRTILFTGLTRDGTFLVENGKVTKSLKNFRWNESPIFILNNLEAVGPAIRINASESSSAGGTVIMPALKVRDFTFTSLSDAI